MTVAEFLAHHALTENPFRGEEARSDSVFARMHGHAQGDAHHHAATFHGDFEKILGSLSQPASSVVFGEKGSGKTAIRMQIGERIAEHNAMNPDRRVLLVANDELNAILDRFHQAVGGKTPADSLKETRLVDHLDIILRTAVPILTDAALARASAGPLDLGPDAKRLFKRLTPQARRDLLQLQALYDREDSAEARTAQLRSRLRVGLPGAGFATGVLLVLLPLMVGGVAVYQHFFAPPQMREPWATWAVVVAGGLYLIYLLKHLAFNRLFNLAQARRIRKQLRILSRGEISFARSLRLLPAALRDSRQLPVTHSDEQRFAFMQKLKRVLRELAYDGLIVVVDRVDEPTLINGDAERMRAFVWPMLNNKFLQQPGVGIKLLLPIELRHALFKESNAFFEQARLDKQSMVERLTWTGSMLYDLCQSRLEACRMTGEPDASLMSLFAEDVTRQDVIEALDQMHQPRDAFKLLYRCISEHCAGVTRDQGQFRIPRLLLETVRKSEADRVQGLYRGIRPA